MKKKARKVVALALGIALAVSSFTTLTPMEAEAAGKTIEVDFSQTDGEMIPKTGWLIMPNENIPDGRIIPLNTKDVRDDFDSQNLLGSNAVVPTDQFLEDVLPNERNRLARVKHGLERMYELGVDNYYPIMAYMPSWIWSNGTPRSAPNDYDVWKQWVKDIVQYMKDNDLDVTEYNVWNENWGISADAFNRMYEEAWWAGKEVMPESKMIGPSPSTDDAGVIQSLANYCEQVGIPLDIVSWHFGNINNIPNFQQGIEDYISQKPTLGEPKYYYEEYTGSNVVGNMQSEFVVLANFDRADIDAAVRGVWQYINGLSDQLITIQGNENPYARRNIWWLMTAYGAMSGTRVKQTGDDLYVASYDEEKGEAKVLIGNQQGDVTINLNNLPFQGENVRIDKYRITDVENDGLQYQGSDASTDCGATLSTNVSFENTSDVWMLVAKKDESIPSDFALMGPDDGLTAGLQPEFSWQASQGATSYDFVISKNKDMSDPVYTKEGITGTSYTLEGTLEKGETYYWTVTARNAYGVREPYNGMYYTLLANDDLEIPGPFTMLQVIDEDYGTELMPRVTWTEARNATKYIIHISEEENFANEITIEVTDPPYHTVGQENNYFYHILTEAEALKPSTHYFMKVEAANDHGSRMMNGTAHEFTTTTADGKPAAFNTTEPGDGATIEPRSTLRWETSLGAFFYRLEIASDPNFEDIVLRRDTITVPAYTLEEDILLPETTYYWRVTAVTKDGEQETECANGVQSFVTSANPTPPITKVAYSAPGGAIVSFDGVQEADSYVIKYGTASGSYTGEVETTEEMAYIPLESDGSYYFSVASVCNGVEGATYNEVTAQKGSSEPAEIVLDEKIEIEGAGNLENTGFTATTGSSGSLAVSFEELDGLTEFESMVACDKIQLAYQAEQDTSVGLYLDGQKVHDVKLLQTEPGEWGTVEIPVECREGSTLKFQKDTKEIGFTLDYMILTKGLTLENLALGKPAAADSSGQTYTADKAVDGKIAGNADFWIGGNKPSADSPNWLTVDLQGKSEIHSIEIALPDIQTWIPRTQEIRILTSMDGADYQEVSPKTSYEFKQGDEGNHNKYTVSFDQPMEAAYVKVEIYSNTAGDVGQIGELYVMGLPKGDEEQDSNLALGKSVTVGGTGYGNGTNITDGNLSTFWDGGADNFPNHATVDLERPYRLSKLEIALPNLGAWTPRSQELEIKTSMDGKEFTTVVEKANYKFDNSENGNKIEIDLGSETVGRYLQVVGYSNDEPSKPGLQIAELSVYGTSTPVTSIDIDQDSMEIPLGASEQLSATLKPAEAEYRDIAWSSSDVTVATVDANGVVTAKAKGECEIRARSLENPDCMDKITVTVGDPVITQIEVKQPDKTEYRIGEELDLTGMTVTARYTDSSEKPVAIDDCVITGYDKNKAGEQTITVSYAGQSATFVVNVKAELTGIVVTPPAQTEYVVGDELNLEGLKVTAKYSDNTQKEISADQVAISGYDKNQTGSQKVTVSYTEDGITKTGSFEVTVKEKPVLGSISLEGPDKTQYWVGEELSLDGLKVIAHYSDGSSRVITDYKVSGFDSTKPGTVTVTVSYTEGEITKTANFTVSIQEKPVNVVLDSITLQGPDKTEYTVGEGMNLDGLKVTAHYSDGSSREVAGYEVSGFDSTKPGTVTVTVSYSEGGITKTTSFDIQFKAESASSNGDNSSNSDSNNGDNISTGDMAPVVGIAVIMLVALGMCLVLVYKRRISNR